jgi:hemerythrin
MRPLQWNDSYSIFLPEIDAEHRNLFRLANDLHAALLSNAPEARLQEALQAFVADIEDHFSHEERLMRSTGYGSYLWHKRQHDGVRQRTKQALEQFAAGDREALSALLEHFAGWLRDHTGLTDRMLGAYLRNYERRPIVAAPAQRFTARKNARPAPSCPAMPRAPAS